MNKNEFLSIGTIVKTSNSENLLMIIGYSMYKYSNGIEKYDYSVCDYPIGILFSNSIKGINHTDIEKIIYEGYRNSDTERFIKDLDLLYNKDDIINQVSRLNNDIDKNEALLENKNTNKIEDNSFISILEGSQINNLHDDEILNTNEEINIVPEEEKEWSIFKNIKFDDPETILNEEYYNGANLVDNDKKTPTEFDFLGDKFSNEDFEDESFTVPSSIKFDEFGNVVAGDSVAESLSINPVNIIFDEFGNVVSDNTTNEEPKTSINNKSNEEELIAFDYEF